MRTFFRLGRADPQDNILESLWSLGMLTVSVLCITVILASSHSHSWDMSHQWNKLLDAGQPLLYVFHFNFQSVLEFKETSFLSLYQPSPFM